MFTITFHFYEYVKGITRLFIDNIEIVPHYWSHFPCPFGSRINSGSVDANDKSRLVYSLLSIQVNGLTVGSLSMDLLNLSVCTSDLLDE